MCTGDNIETATAISLNAGIVTKEKKRATKAGKGYACMTGEKFREFVGGIRTSPPDADGNTEDCVANMANFRKV
jgi:magnesium-transporting ATPase (P-type)